MTAETTNRRPECFGKFRSPQQDAEADCESCRHDAVCMGVWERAVTRGRDAGTKLPTAFGDWAAMYGWNR